MPSPLKENDYISKSNIVIQNQRGDSKRMLLGSRHMSLEAPNERNTKEPYTSSNSPVKSRQYQNQPRENPYQTVDHGDQVRHLDDIRNQSRASQMPTTS